MPLVETSRFGRLEYEEGAEIEFRHGIPGFDRQGRFVVVEQAALAPLMFLQSLETPGLCFPAVPAAAIDPGYRLEVTREDLEGLGLDPERQPEPGREVLCLAIVAAVNGGLTANLLAPIVINLARRLGLQAVRADARYSHQYPLGDPSPADRSADGGSDAACS
jgi:flagellar assembly factor FliW